jgi:ParB-like chromosome segregation protein Spo0J
MTAQPKPLGSALIGETSIDRIIVADRFRKDFGDLESLARSIQSEGLLQPVGITMDHRLVFGERRLRACRDVLGRKTIETRIVDVSSIIAGEFAENEMRKDFTPSERVAIAAAIEAELGNRRGQRTDKALPANGPEVVPAKETREIAAQKAGFASTTQFRRAKAVVEKAAPAVIEAMDKGDVSISAAAVLADEPAETQEAIAKLSVKDIKAAVRSIRKEQEAAALRASAQRQEDREGPNLATQFVKKHGRIPSPAEASKMARIMGVSVLSTARVFESPLPPDELAEAQRRNGCIDDLIEALGIITKIPETPEKVATYAEDYDRGPIDDLLSKAMPWLAAFIKEWPNHA